MSNALTPGVVIEIADLDVESWANGVEHLLKSSGFEHLEDPIWQSGNLQSYFANLPTTQPSKPPDRYGHMLGKLIDYTVFYGLLQLQAEEPYYQKEAAYRPLAVLRNGRLLDEHYFQSDEQPANQNLPRELFLGAKILLLSVIKFYLANLEIIKLRKPNGNSFGISPNKIRLPNVKKYLFNFLRLFDDIFSHRTVLSTADWLFAFYALCLFSMANSLLIDTLSHLSNQPWPSQWYRWDATQMNSMYKVLVSIFIWSAKTQSGRPPSLSKLKDPLLLNWSSSPPPALLRSSVLIALMDTQRLTRVSSWDRSGIKSSKDFLMSLGAGDSRDIGFNGFLAQQYGQKSYPWNTDDASEMRVAGAQFTGMGSSNFNVSTGLDTAMTNTNTLGSGVEMSQESISRSSTFPQASKLAQRSYTWDRAEARMKELNRMGMDVPSIVNSVLAECFSDING